MDVTEFIAWAAACGADPKGAFERFLEHNLMSSVTAPARFPGVARYSADRGRTCLNTSFSDSHLSHHGLVNCGGSQLPLDSDPSVRRGKVSSRWCGLRIHRAVTRPRKNWLGGAGKVSAW